MKRVTLSSCILSRYSLSNTAIFQSSIALSAFEKVLNISENTLRVLSVSKALDKEQIALEAMIDYCTNLVGNKDLIISLQSKGITISNN